jgi:N6-L-threonylcarbamoyladenine synthase
MAALKATREHRLVVSGGVGANSALRERLRADVTKRGARVYFPELQWCTDNGAMIALAASMRMAAGIERAAHDYSFTVKPRWDLGSLTT